MDELRKIHLYISFLIVGTLVGILSLISINLIGRTLAIITLILSIWALLDVFEVGKKEEKK